MRWFAKQSSAVGHVTDFACAASGSAAFAINKRYIPGAVLSAGAAAVLALSQPAAATPAQYECYDFGGLAPNTEYNVGDVIDARHARIEIGQYFSGGSPATADARKVKVVSSKIAGGAAPEVSVYLARVKVNPNGPVTRVRMNIAQSIAKDGGHANANIEVNGDKHEAPGGIAQMNGKTIGPSAAATLVSSMAPVGGSDSNWHAGTLEIRANTGRTIDTFSIGGVALRLDNLCFAK